MAIPILQMGKRRLRGFHKLPTIVQLCGSKSPALNIVL